MDDNEIHEFDAHEGRIGIVAVTKVDFIIVARTVWMLLHVLSEVFLGEVFVPMFLDFAELDSLLPHRDSVEEFAMQRQVQYRFAHAVKCEVSRHPQLFSRYIGMTL